ncbi:hypothetical protein AB0J80_07445 [Actinoplanes sp. NPDC049548]|uniref:hypothetical protein n=1 Tax=Actinoplanes sp. NPDC049548 TaxID=3155152 RepID=UPI0034159F3A
MTRHRTALVMLAVVAATGAVFAVAGLLRRDAAPAGPPDVGSSGAPAGSFDPDYWTPERMRSAEPAPGPDIPG